MFTYTHVQVHKENPCGNTHMASGHFPTQQLSPRFLFHWPNETATSQSSMRDKTALSMQTGSPSPDRSHKLCWLTNSKAGRPAGAQNKSRPLQAAISIQHCLLTIRKEYTSGNRNIVWAHGHAAWHLATQRWPAMLSTAMVPAASRNRTSTELFQATAALCSSPSCIISSVSPTSIPSSTFD